MLVWQGKSRFDGTTIAAWLQPGGNANRKIGSATAQLWIEPIGAAAFCPESVCGSCPQRAGGCYVFPPSAFGVRAAIVRAAGETVPAERWTAAVSGRLLRLGAHGDPAALPAAIVRKLAAASRAVVGYTHAWRRDDVQWLRAFAMASTEDLAGTAQAQAMGWRTYRVRPAGTTPADRPDAHPAVRSVVTREIECPAMSHGRTCDQCRLCFGAHPTAPSITIAAHGGAVSRLVTRNTVKL